MFGQVIFGLANSGKTTYCKFMGEYIKNQDRKIKIINLDPGVEDLPYTCDIDIRDMVCIRKIMEEEQLGPNESFVYAMEFLLANIKWLDFKLSKLLNDSYLIIDMPGQVELYTQHKVLYNILNHLTNPKGLNCRLTSVFLAESIYCQDTGSYIQIVLSTLVSMMHIALPRVNIFSKSNKISQKDLLFPSKDLKEVKYLDFMVDHVKGRRNKRKRQLLQGIVDMIIDSPWLSFTFFDYENERSYEKVIEQIDCGNGFIVKQKFLSLLDDKNNQKEKDFDKAADELVDQFF